MMRLSLLFAISFATFAAAASAAPRCAGLTLARALPCEETGVGVVIAETAERARQFVDFARQGEARYRRHFSDRIAPYAIYFVDNADGADRDALKRQGFAFVLPWKSGAQLVKDAGPALRASIEKQLGEQGIPRNLWDQVTNQYVAKLPAELDARAGGLVPHELGHLWLIHGYWPAATSGGNEKHYGSPAPDWLDELAAVMMEDDALTAQRRAHLKTAMAGSNPKVMKPWPLAEFLAMAHPNAKEGPVPADGISVSGPSPSGLTFYAQARGFADFLIAQSRDEKIFDAIAQAFARKETLDAWLVNEGQRRNLGTSVAELESRWAAWLKAHVN